MGKLQYGDRQSVDHQRGRLANYNVRLERRRLSPLRRALRALIKPSHLSNKKGTCDRIAVMSAFIISEWIVLFSRTAPRIRRILFWGNTDLLFECLTKRINIGKAEDIGNLSNVHSAAGKHTASTLHHNPVFISHRRSARKRFEQSAEMRSADAAHCRKGRNRYGIVYMIVNIFQCRTDLSPFSPLYARTVYIPEKQRQHSV